MQTQTKIDSPMKNGKNSTQVIVLLYADELVTVEKSDQSETNINIIDFDQQYSKLVDGISERIPEIVSFDANTKELEEDQNANNQPPDECDDDSITYSSEDSSSSSSSSSLGDECSESALIESGNEDTSYLPIDVVFTIPSVIVMISYMFASSAFYDIFVQFNSFVSNIFSKIHYDTFSILSLVVGVVLLRLTGDLWWYGLNIDSERFYNQFYETKYRRKRIAKRHILLQRTLTDNDSFFTKLKSSMTAMDVRILRYFREHYYLKLFVSLVGCYLVYIPCSHFYYSKMMKLAEIPRSTILESLPSAQESSGINPSPIFRSLLASEITDLKPEQIGKWNETIQVDHQWPDLVLHRKSMSESELTQSCSSFNGTINDYLAWEDALYAKDYDYLYNLLSSNSYYAFFGSAPASLISSKGYFLASFSVFTISVCFLSYMKVSFLEIGG